MKLHLRYVFILLTFWIVNVSTAQTFDTYVVFKDIDTALTSDERQKVNAAYGTNADRVVFNNPTMLKNIKDILRNRVRVYKPDPNKMRDVLRTQEIIDINTLSLKDGLGRSNTSAIYTKESFNPLVYTWNLYPIQLQTYTFGDYIVQIIPQKRKVK